VTGATVEEMLIYVASVVLAIVCDTVVTVCWWNFSESWQQNMSPAVRSMTLLLFSLWDCRWPM